MNYLGRNIISLEQSQDQPIHTFSLRALSGRLEARIPEVKCTAAVYGSSNSRMIFPKFNNDGRYFTAAFVNSPPSPLPSLAGSAASEQEIIQKTVFEENVRAMTSKNSSSLYEPKPSSTYCSVCHEGFADYLRHVSHPVHLARIHNDKYSELIDYLVQDYALEGGKRFSDALPFDHQDIGCAKKRRKLDEPHKQRKPNTKEVQESTNAVSLMLEARDTSSNVGQKRETF